MGVGAALAATSGSSHGCRFLRYNSHDEHFEMKAGSVDWSCVFLSTDNAASDITASGYRHVSHTSDILPLYYDIVLYYVVLKNVTELIHVNKCEKLPCFSQNIYNIADYIVKVATIESVIRTGLTCEDRR